MSSIQLDAAAELAAFDAAQEWRKEREKEIKRVELAHARVATFIHTSTERTSPRERGRTVTSLPDEPDALLTLSTDFALVDGTFYDKQRYLNKILVSADEFDQLQAEVELAAVALMEKPLRDQTPDLLPQA